MTRTSRRVGGVATDTSAEIAACMAWPCTRISPEFRRSSWRITRRTMPLPVPGTGRLVYGGGRHSTASLDLASETTLLEWLVIPRTAYWRSLLAHPTERLLYVSTGENNQNARLTKYVRRSAQQGAILSDLRGKGLGGLIRMDPFPRTIRLPEPPGRAGGHLYR